MSPDSLFSGIASARASFRITDLERHPPRGLNAPHPSAHAIIANEHGWLWLNRDGSPTLLTEDVYKTLAWACLLGGLTEYWRVSRYYAGILHFVYLTCSYPGVFTSDHWRDVEKLELDPDFEAYAKHAFNPLGVYLNFWQPRIKPGEQRRIDVSVINDEAREAIGDLVLTIENAEGRELLRASRLMHVGPLGQQTLSFNLKTAVTR